MGRLHLMYAYTNNLNFSTIITYNFRFEERTILTETINKNLNDIIYLYPLIYLYCNFLDWVLPKFIYLNKLFQSEK